MTAVATMDEDDSNALTECDRKAFGRADLFRFSTDTERHPVVWALPKR